MKSMKQFRLTCKRYLCQHLFVNPQLDIFQMLVILLVILAGAPSANGASSQLSLDVTQTLGNGLSSLSNEAQYLDGLLGSIITAPRNTSLGSWGTQTPAQEEPGGSTFKGDPIELAGLHEGDILLPETQLGLSQSVWDSLNELAEVSSSPGRGSLWPDGVVAYEFADDFDYLPMERVLIQWTMKNIEDKSCVKFVKRTSQRDYVRIIYDSYKCYSSVGRVGGQQPLSLGMFCSLLWDRGNIYHELLHALGFYHEHTRPDRDEHVEVQWQNIKKGMEVNFKKDRRWEDDLLDMPYDLGSVMHYSSQAFSKMYFLYPTILSKEKGLFFMRPKEPSKLDYAKLNHLYKCPKNSRRLSRLLPKRREKEGRSLGGGSSGGINLFGRFGKLFRGLTSTLQPPPIAISHKTFLRPPPLPPLHQQLQHDFVAQYIPSLHTQGLQHNYKQEQRLQQNNELHHHDDKQPVRYDLNSFDSAYTVGQPQNYEHQPTAVGPDDRLHNPFGTSVPTGSNAIVRQNPYLSATHYGSVNTGIIQGNSEQVQHVSNGDLALRYQHASQPNNEGQEQQQLQGLPLPNKDKRHISAQSYSSFNTVHGQTNEEPAPTGGIRGNGKFKELQWTHQGSRVSTQSPNLLSTSQPGNFRSFSNLHGNALGSGNNFSSVGARFMLSPSVQSPSHAIQQTFFTNSQVMHNNWNTFPMTFVPQNDHFHPSNYQAYSPSFSLVPPQPEVYGLTVPPALVPPPLSANGGKAFLHHSKDYHNFKFNGELFPLSSNFQSLTNNFIIPHNAVHASNSFHTANINDLVIGDSVGPFHPISYPR